MWRGTTRHAEVGQTMEVTNGTADQILTDLASAAEMPAAVVLTHRRVKRGTYSLRSREARRHHVSKHPRRQGGDRRRCWLGVLHPTRLNEDRYRAWQRWMERRKTAAQKKRKTN